MLGIMREGWEIKKLGEVLVKTETVDPTKKPDLEFTYLDVSSVNKETKEIETATVLLGKDAPSRARKLVKTNDVIFATVRPTHSRVALITDEYNEQVCSTGYFVLRGKDFIFNQYLYYFLLTDEFNGQMEKLQKGASYPAVTDAEVKSILLRYPKSLPEQQRIVSILDEAFAAIAVAKTNAEENLKNTKELFESYLQGVFSTKNSNWKEKCLDELGVITSSKRIYKSEYVNEGIPFYRTKEIKELSNGKDITLELFISRERYNDIKNTFGVPQINDLLMSAVGTIGEIMVIENENEFYFKDGNIVWFKEFKSLDTNYLKFALTAFVEKIKSLAIGAAYSALTIEKLNKYKISYPENKIDQQAIVQKLDALSVETKRLESIYQQKLLDLEELKKSVLQKAFNGEL
jgi:type I restriction enzyme, S subunit